MIEIARESANVFVGLPRRVGRLISVPLLPLSLDDHSGLTCSVLFSSRHHEPAALLGSLRPSSPYL